MRATSFNSVPSLPNASPVSAEFFTESQMHNLRLFLETLENPAVRDQFSHSPKPTSMPSRHDAEKYEALQNKVNELKKKNDYLEKEVAKQTFKNEQLKAAQHSGFEIEKLKQIAADKEIAQGFSQWLPTPKFLTTDGTRIVDTMAHAGISSSLHALGTACVGSAITTGASFASKGSLTVALPLAFLSAVATGCVGVSKYFAQHEANGTASYFIDKLGAGKKLGYIKNDPDTLRKAEWEHQLKVSSAHGQGQLMV